MADKPMNKRIEGYQVRQKGYQPTLSNVSLGHQPRPQASINLRPQNLKPPKGGSAIQPPNNSKPVKP